MRLPYPTAGRADAPRHPAVFALGPYSITARQGQPGELESADSAVLTITIDTAAPVVEAFGLSGIWANWSVGVIDSSAWTTGRQQRTAPWSLASELVVGFDGPVAAAIGDVTLIGADSFVKAAQRARERLPNRDAALAAAAVLKDLSVRQTFFDLLLDLARTDGLDLSETELLKRLSTLWQLEWSG